MRRKKIGKRLFSLLVTVMLVGTMPFSSMPVMAGTAEAVQDTTQLDRDVDETTEETELTTAKAPEATTGAAEATTGAAEVTTAAPEATTVGEAEVTTAPTETTTAGTTVTEATTETSVATTEQSGDDNLIDKGDLEKPEDSIEDEAGLLRNSQIDQFQETATFQSTGGSYLNVNAGVGGKVKFTGNNQAGNAFLCGSGEAYFAIQADEGYKIANIEVSGSPKNSNRFVEFTQSGDKETGNITIFNRNGFTHIHVDPLYITVKVNFDKVEEEGVSIGVGTEYSGEAAGHINVYKVRDNQREYIETVSENHVAGLLDISSKFAKGDEIVLEAVPKDKNSQFTGWSGLQDIEGMSQFQGNATINFVITDKKLSLTAGFGSQIVDERGNWTILKDPVTDKKTEMVFNSEDEGLYQSRVSIKATTGGYISKEEIKDTFSCGFDKFSFTVEAEPGYVFDGFEFQSEGVEEENITDHTFFGIGQTNLQSGTVTVSHAGTVLDHWDPFNKHTHHHGCTTPEILSLKVVANFKKVSQDVTVQVNFLEGDKSILKPFTASAIQVDLGKKDLSFGELKAQIPGLEEAIPNKIVLDEDSYDITNRPGNEINYSIKDGKIMIDIQYKKGQVKPPEQKPLNINVVYKDDKGNIIPDYTIGLKVNELKQSYTLEELMMLDGTLSGKLQDKIISADRSIVYTLLNRPDVNAEFSCTEGNITIELNYKLQYFIRVDFKYFDQDGKPIIGFGEGLELYLDNAEEQFKYSTIRDLIGDNIWKTAVVQQFPSKDGKLYKLLKQPTADQTFDIEMVSNHRTITIPLIYGEVKETVPLKVNVQYQDAQGKPLTEHPAKDFSLQVEKLKDAYTYKDLKDLNSEDLNKAIVTELTVGGRTYELTKALTDDQALAFENGQVTLILQYKEKSTGGGSTGGGSTGGGSTGGGGTTPSNPGNNGNVTPPADDNNNDDVIVDDNEVPLAPGTDDADSNDNTDDSINNDNDVTVDDDDVPLAKQPDKDAKDKASKDKVSKNKDNSEVNVEDDNVPLANLPKTGDVSNHFGAVALPAGLLMVLQLLKRKDKITKETK